MGYTTKYGGFWGLLPQTAGRIFWVAASASYQVSGTTYTASDSNDGLAPERAFLTTDYAVGQCTANVGDVIVLLHGVHDDVAAVAVDVAGITITGIPGSTPVNGGRGGGIRPLNRSSITNTATAGIIFTVTVADVEFAYLDIEPTSAGGRGFRFSQAASRAYIHDCNIIMDATASTTTYGIHYYDDVTGVNSRGVIRNCYFVSGTTTTSGANGPAILAGGSIRGMLIEQCTFELLGTAAWADCILSTGITNELTIRDCDFLTPAGVTTVMTGAIDVTLATTEGACKVLRCYFSQGSDAFQMSATGDLHASDCYVLTSTVNALQFAA
mgnify:CR=1 FL=1